MNVMNYKGYAARIEYSEEDGLFVGHIAGIRDVVGFMASRYRKFETHLKRPSLIIWKLAPSSDEDRAHA